ncbi:Hypothetical predicted protein [Octopus vulgaris]|uniref:Uncharacterized protein n=1 Tax=Octopus vulgaris TaxID=6645 RepID=A0AA36BJX1_OCTVU|nr:Hypothetical predicted protein [Octopus vulgaris]
MLEKSQITGDQTFSIENYRSRGYIPKSSVELWIDLAFSVSITATRELISNERTAIPIVIEIFITNYIYNSQQRLHLNKLLLVFDAKNSIPAALIHRSKEKYS